MSSSRLERRRALFAWLALGALGTLGALLPGGASQAADYPNIGRAATPAELRAWDIDVRPDFKGLPKGGGTVAEGMQLWEAQCASCHGVFGESNEVFQPLVGGSTAADIERGRVARLTDAAYPGRTTLMKLSSLSTLWDYIQRAMPWNRPKSLSPDEVYALSAYLLHLGDVLPADFRLSDANIAEVQRRLPNRDGMTTAHGLWPGRGLGHGRPDVRARACMKDCAPEPRLASQLPEHARNAHGNLAEQNRLVGAQRGADTARAPVVRAQAPEGAAALAARHGCVACHASDRRLVGPSWREIGQRHAGRADAPAYLQGKIRAGGAGVWGPVPMPAQTLPEQDALALARWLAGLPPQSSVRGE